MRSLPVMGTEPEYPTASELHRAAECVAPWALGLERHDESGVDAAWGRLCHAGAEALARGDVIRDALSVAPSLDEYPRLMAVLTHVRDALDADRDALFDCVDAAGKAPWFVEQGVSWKPWDRTARLVERQPGQRFQGEFSGTADLVYVRGDGVVIVVDWKFGVQTARIGEPAEEHAQGWTLALGFVTALGVKQYGDAHVVARFEARHVNEEGVRVDGVDITAGELAAWARELEKLAAKINAGQTATPRRSHACGRCSARAACPSWQELAEAVTFELAPALEADVLARPPQTPKEVRLLNDAILAGERHVERWREWRRAYVLTHEPVPVGLGLELAALRRKERKMLQTPESLAVVERVAPGGVVVEEKRKATIESVKRAVRDAAGAGIVSTADRNKAKAAAEARAFDELEREGALVAAGTTWAIGLRRSDGTVEVLERVEEDE